MGALRLAFVVIVLAVVTFAMMPLQLVAMRRNWRIAERIPWYWQRAARKVTGLRVTVEGTPAAPPLLIASNHVSWLDITTLGSVIPLSFIAKTEVAGWPVFGTLARLQRSVFIDRTRRHQTGAATEAIARRIGAGDTIVLFAEGTTGDGNFVLPFRSALLGAASAATGLPAVTVQPVAIVYRRRGGLPVGRADNPGIAWYGDMDLIPHFRSLVEDGAVDATVAFGEPYRLGPGDDRKKVAEACHFAVRSMIRDIRAGRPIRKSHAPAIFSAPAKEAKGTADRPPSGPPAAEPDIDTRVS